MEQVKSEELKKWQPGVAPVAVVMISLNEGHNMERACENLKGWAQAVYLVDSFSRDNTVDIALRYGVHVVQRKFTDFGDQWNFALRELPIDAGWTMKLDPDERLTEKLKLNLKNEMEKGDVVGLSVDRHLWFMEKPLPIKQTIVRLWKTGQCKFSDVAVNEHALVQGDIRVVKGVLEHHDSPDLDHWLEKQNRYTTDEAVIAYNESPLADVPKLFGTSLQRRMWLKKNFRYVPGRFGLLFLYYYLLKGTWKAGWVGYVWARFRAEVNRLIEYKRREMEITGKPPIKRLYGSGKADPRVKQFE